MQAAARPAEHLGLMRDSGASRAPVSTCLRNARPRFAPITSTVRTVERPFWCFIAIRKKYWETLSTGRKKKLVDLDDCNGELADTSMVLTLERIIGGKMGTGWNPRAFLSLQSTVGQGAPLPTYGRCRDATMSGNKSVFQIFFGANPDRLHFAAHSHHPLARRERDARAHMAAWEDAATLADNKWTRSWAGLSERSQHVAENVNSCPDPGGRLWLLHPIHMILSCAFVRHSRAAGPGMANPTASFTAFAGRWTRLG